MGTIDSQDPWFKCRVERGLCFLMPSFVFPENTQRAQPYPISPLDGLRGLASILVFLRHLLSSLYKFPDYGYGTPQDAWQNDSILQLPFIKMVYCGNVMLCVLLLISGYTQAYGKIGLMNRRDWGGLQKSLTSSSFGRGPRLYIPTACAAALTTVFVWLGLYDWGPENRIRAHTPVLQKQMKFQTQASLMWTSFLDLFNLFDWERIFPEYNIHTWSIPVQLRSSMLLYLFLTMIARMDRRSRRICTALVILVCFSSGQWELYLTFLGVLLADIDVSRDQTQRAEQGLSKKQSRLTNFCWLVILTAALYSGSYPNYDGKNAPGFQTMARISPARWSNRFWQSVSALLLLQTINSHSQISIVLCRWLRRPVLQYLGRISFSIFLLHGPVMHVVSFALIPFCWNILGRDTSAQGAASFLLPTVFVAVPVLIWVSDVFWRLVDRPSGTLIRRLQHALFVDLHPTLQGNNENRLKKS